MFVFKGVKFYIYHGWDEERGSSTGLRMLRPELLQDVGIDHSGGDVFVAEELLDGANIVPAFEEMSSKTVPEGVTGGGLGQAGGADGFFDGVL